MQQFIDRFAAWYTPSVVILAVLVATRAGAGVRPAVRHVALSLAGAARRVVPVRAGDLDAGVDRVGARRRGAAGRAREGRHSPRAARRCSRGRLRQDRHGDDRPPHARCGACRSTATPRTKWSGWRPRSNRSPNIRLPPRSSPPRTVARPAASTCRPMFARCPGSASRDACRTRTIVCGTPRLFTERGAMTPAIAALAQDRRPQRACRRSSWLATACRSACSASPIGPRPMRPAWSPISARRACRVSR